MKCPKYSLGIDINPNYIGIIELFKKNRICTSILEPIQHSAEETVQKIFAAHPMHTSQCHLAISSIKIIKKNISFSNVLREQDILQELETNPAKYFDGIQENLCIDFQRIEKNTAQSHYLVFAAKKTDIQYQIDLLKSFNIKPTSIEPDYCSLLRPANHQLKQDSKITALYLFNKRIIVYGKNQLLSDISFHDPIDKLQIQHIIKHFHIKHPEKKIAICYSHLTKHLENLEIPTKKINVVSNAELHIAYGLALRGLNE